MYIHSPHARTPYSYKRLRRLSLENDPTDFEINKLTSIVKMACATYPYISLAIVP
jgi:hypothetical protein